MQKVVAFVPAKGSSDRIKNKNLAILDGEHLFKRKLRQLCECPVIHEVILDTDDDVIADLASDLPIRRLRRPAELASNATDGHELFAWECSQVEADIYIQSLCTAPFVGPDTVNRALQQLMDTPDADSLVAVTESKQYLWHEGVPAYGRGRIPNSVDLSLTTIEAMSLYMVRKKGNASPVRRFSEHPLMFKLTPNESIDVNWPEDLELAETIAAGQRARENLVLGALAPYLTSAMLSDITREMGLQCTMPKEISSMSSRKIFGRAKTMLLDSPQEGESWQRIYDALGSYAFIRQGDIIVVENRVPEHAYFGNLNAQLAMRAGAIGAVIDGVTRDREAVAALHFPVYARGQYCVDIKFQGVLRDMNKPVHVGAVRIENGDYILADGDGVTIVPRAFWPEVRARSLTSIEKEWRVGRAVAIGESPETILQQLGEF